MASCKAPCSSMYTSWPFRSINPTVRPANIITSCPHDHAIYWTCAFLKEQNFRFRQPRASKSCASRTRLPNSSISSVKNDLAVYLGCCCPESRILLYRHLDDIHSTCFACEITCAQDANSIALLLGPRDRGCCGPPLVRHGSDPRLRAHYRELLHPCFCGRHAGKSIEPIAGYHGEAL